LTKELISSIDYLDFTGDATTFTNLVEKVHTDVGDSKLKHIVHDAEGHEDEDH